jgi:CHASE2 domain-containing sensor protein
VPKGSVVNGAMEWIGFACLVAFSYFVWPPAAFATAGVVLVVVANLRDAQRDPNRQRLVDRLARALAAYRSAGGSS